MIFTITGPSGAGKSTLMRNLLGAMPVSFPLESITTRLEKEGDIPNEFTRVSREDFFARASAGEFMKVYTVHDCLFGTRKALIKEALRTEIPYFATLTIDAVREMHVLAIGLGASDHFRSLYVYLDPETTRERLIVRARESMTQIERRMRECADWNEKARYAGIRFRVIDNRGTKEESLDQALRFLRSPRCIPPSRTA